MDTVSQKQRILKELLETLHTRLKDDSTEQFAVFLNHLFEHASVSELESYSARDLVGLSLSLRRHVQEWDGRQAKISVFNPNIEEQEWQSPHTVVAILAREIPFILDSARLVLNRTQSDIYTIFHAPLGVARDSHGKLTSIAANESNTREFLVYFEIDHKSNSSELSLLKAQLELVLSDVECVVDDYQPILEKSHQMMDMLGALASAPDQAEVEEARVFFKWLGANHFTFLGYDEYEIQGDTIQMISNSALGLSKQIKDPVKESGLSKETSSFLFENNVLDFVKSGKRSTVHRSAYSDYIIVKKYDEQGNVVGGCRFLGLYTSVVYNNSPKNIPVIRKKIAEVLSLSGFQPNSHNFKELSQILHTLPRDELIQSRVQELFDISSQILTIQERRQIRLFFRKDPYHKFLIVLMYIPRDVYNTELREQVRLMLMEHFDVLDWDFATFFSESILARTRFVFRLRNPIVETINQKSLEQKAISIARQWHDELQSALVDVNGEELGLDLYRNYNQAFPASYKEKYIPRVAVADIDRMERLYLNQSTSLSLSFYQSLDVSSSVLKLKIFHQDSPLLLSDLIPVLENMGLKVVDEFPYKIAKDDNNFIWIYDFSLLYVAGEKFDPGPHKQAFTDAFINTWYKKADNDLFNKLILGAGLNWRQVAMLRAYSRYMKQVKFSYSGYFISETLSLYPDIACKIVGLFEARFNPSKPTQDYQAIYDGLLKQLDQVSNLSEDRVLRHYLELIEATDRTNFYQQEKSGGVKEYFSFKIRPEKIDGIPLPKPKFEIFVYSPRVEGVHLRTGKVARGGLRWSDRQEDYRTEILGLVKAQQVKNSVIVPVGAKGGFVAKTITKDAGRDEMMAEGIACYQLFIKGLLDVTDNLIEGQLVPPSQVVRHDEDDPYLVVAADKGTASFSDIANELATSYGHWLGDAFASGGSQGYDHKKMGITAKGAWVSVQRHFREMGVDVQMQPISVVAIGDMSGDVFGNGMLRSETIKLKAAFNHLHIFIDPDPDPDLSFKERARLFALPRSSWSDYDQKIISKGGGVFSRNVKSIAISAEMKREFGISENRLAPYELIRYLLTSKVDLLWNGGIGTYIKGSIESHADVGDKANDMVRVNGEKVKAKVIGEGGNLGVTQLGRIDYAKQGGLCFTDSIDNAGGVDCSDHEVNIKILLDELVAQGDLTVKQRNDWLQSMTDAVTGLVLTNNYRQAQSLNLSFLENKKRIEEYRRLINYLEAQGKLKRSLEYIPDDDELSERKASNVGLTRPELAVLISYSKGDLKEQLSNSSIVEDTYVEKEVETSFPKELTSAFSDAVYQHRLKTEIVATQIANDVFNHMGITYLHRLQESTGAPVEEIAKSYIAARDIFGLHQVWREIEEYDHKLESDVQNALMLRTARVVRRASRWFIKNYRLGINVQELVETFRQPLSKISGLLDEILSKEGLLKWQEELDTLASKGVPESLARRVLSFEYLYNCLGVVVISRSLDADVVRVAAMFFMLGEKLSLNEFAGQLELISAGSHWQARARESYRDDLEWQQRRITQSVLAQHCQSVDLDECVSTWMEKNQLLINRWHKMVSEILAASKPEFSMYSVAIRELLDLSQSGEVD